LSALTLRLNPPLHVGLLPPHRLPAQSQRRRREVRPRLDAAAQLLDGYAEHACDDAAVDHGSSFA
jgi:hypothetical protein